MGFGDFLKQVGRGAKKLLNGVKNSAVYKGVMTVATKIPGIGGFARSIDGALGTATGWLDGMDFGEDPEETSYRAGKVIEQYPLYPGAGYDRNMSAAFGGGMMQPPQGRMAIGPPPSTSGFDFNPFSAQNLGNPSLKRPFDEQGGRMNPYKNMGGNGRPDMMNGGMSMPTGQFSNPNAYLHAGTWQDRATVSAHDRAMSAPGYQEYERAKQFNTLQGNGARIQQMAALGGSFSPQTGAFPNNRYPPNNSMASYTGNVYGGGNGTYGGGSRFNDNAGVNYTGEYNVQSKFQPSYGEQQAYANQIARDVSF